MKLVHRFHLGLLLGNPLCPFVQSPLALVFLHANDPTEIRRSHLTVSHFTKFEGHAQKNVEVNVKVVNTWTNLLYSHSCKWCFWCEQ